MSHHKIEIKYVTRSASGYTKRSVFYARSVADAVGTISRWGASGASPTDTEVEKLSSREYVAKHHRDFETRFTLRRVY